MSSLHAAAFCVGKKMSGENKEGGAGTQNKRKTLDKSRQKISQQPSIMSSIEQEACALWQDTWAIVGGQGWGWPEHSQETFWYPPVLHIIAFNTAERASKQLHGGMAFLGNVSE